MKTKTSELVAQWGIQCASARFSEWGNWYAAVSKFPVALLDSHGYILFQTNEALRSSDGVRVTKQINIPDGISSLHGYHLRSGSIPEQIQNDELFIEGAKTTISVNRYERNPAARLKCLRHHGYRCKICDWSGLGTYGVEAARLIHVHHLRALGEIGASYQLDPIRDLCPVCPNCHAFIHLFTPVLSIEEAKIRIKK
jgi:hypothetical protein